MKRGIDIIRAMLGEPTALERQRALDALQGIAPGGPRSDAVWNLRPKAPDRRRSLWTLTRVISVPSPMHGAICWVEEQRAYFVFYRFSSAVPNGTTVVPDGSGEGTWHKVTVG